MKQPPVYNIFIKRPSKKSEHHQYRNQPRAHFYTWNKQHTNTSSFNKKKKQYVFVEFDSSGITGSRSKVNNLIFIWLCSAKRNNTTNDSYIKKSVERQSSDPGAKRDRPETGTSKGLKSGHFLFSLRFVIWLADTCFDQMLICLQIAHTRDAGHYSERTIN